MSRRPAIAQPEDQAQQRAGLFHRDDRRPMQTGCWRRHCRSCSSTARPPPVRCASPRWRCQRSGDADPERRQPRAGDRKAALSRPESGRFWTQSRPHRRWPPARWPRSTLRRPWPIWPRRRTGASPMVDDSRAFQIDRRAASGGGARAAAAGRQPFVANDCALTDRRHAGDLAADRAEHGGQIHLPAAERADRAAGAGGQLSCRRPAPGSAWSASCSAGSARRTTWRGGGRPSWSRWSRRRRS